MHGALGTYVTATAAETSCGLPLADSNALLPAYGIAIAAADALGLLVDFVVVLGLALAIAVADALCVLSCPSLLVEF